MQHKCKRGMQKQNIKKRVVHEPNNLKHDVYCEALAHSKYLEKV